MGNITRRGVIAGGVAIGAGGALSGHAVAHDPSTSPLGAWTPLPTDKIPFCVQEIYPAAFWKKSSDATSFKPTPADIIVSAGGLYDLSGDCPPPQGASRFNVTNAVIFYDPAYGAWGYGAPLPQPRHHIALVSNNGQLHAIGGFSRNEDGLWRMRTECWRTDSVSGPWSAIAPLPHPQAESVVASFGGFIHVVGGRAPSGSANARWDDHIDTDEHWLYDAAANKWVPLAPMPAPRHSLAGAVSGGVLYVFGGQTVSDGASTESSVYDPLSDRWGRIKPMPRALAGLSAVTHGRKIYLFGGATTAPFPGVTTREVWEYDPNRDEWRAVAAMPVARHGHGAVKLGDSIYVFGGAQDVGAGGTTNRIDRFDI